MFFYSKTPPKHIIKLLALLVFSFSFSLPVTLVVVVVVVVVGGHMNENLGHLTTNDMSVRLMWIMPFVNDSSRNQDWPALIVCTQHDGNGF